MTSENESSDLRLQTGKLVRVSHKHIFIGEKDICFHSDLRADDVKQVWFAVAVPGHARAVRLDRGQVFVKSGHVLQYQTVTHLPATMKLEAVTVVWGVVVRLMKAGKQPIPKVQRSM